MRWDEFLTVENAPAQQQGDALPMLPDDTHVAEITAAWIEPVDFDWAKSATNTEGKCLKLALEKNGFRQFEATVPCHFTGKVEAICRAARVDAPARGVDWDEKQLKGRVVAVETKQAVSQRGREYVRIEKWLPGPEQLPKAVRETPARKPAAKAAAAFKEQANADDLPF